MSLEKDIQEFQAYQAFISFKNLEQMWQKAMLCFGRYYFCCFEGLMENISLRDRKTMFLPSKLSLPPFSRASVKWIIMIGQ